jgi:hypothetical protein
MLSSLPQELFEKIGLLLDTRSYLKLSRCNQELYRKANSSDFVWKIKAKQEYSKILDSNYKTKYIKFYKTLCIVCYRKTASKHPFYNTKICKKCQSRSVYFNTVTGNICKRLFCIYNSDLQVVPHRKKYNYLNKSRPIKLYLLTDILKIVKTKFGSFDQMLITRRKLEYIKLQRKLLYHTRFMVLRSILLEQYDVDILDFSMYLNSYSKGIFRRFIHNISKNQNIILAETLVNYCIELDFLVKHQISLQEITLDDFPFYLKRVLLTNSLNDQIYSRHITNTIDKVNETYKSEFERKIFLEKYLSGLDYHLEDIQILRYIETGEGDISEIKLDIIEENFALTLPGSRMFRDFMTFHYSRNDHYSLLIRKAISRGASIPIEIKHRYTFELQQQFPDST